MGVMADRMCIARTGVTRQPPKAKASTCALSRIPLNLMAGLKPDSVNWIYRRQRMH